MKENELILPKLINNSPKISRKRAYSQADQFNISIKKPTKINSTSIDSYQSNKISGYSPHKKKAQSIMKFSEYADKINVSMAKYQDSVRDTKEDSDEAKLSYGEETMIKSVLKRNNSSLHIDQSEESMLKISISDRDFKNPFNSFRMLKKNKRIYQDVTQSFLERQENVYFQAIEQFNKETMQYRVKLPHVKVTGLMKLTKEENQVIPPIKEEEEVLTSPRQTEADEKNKVQKNSIPDIQLIVDSFNDKANRLYCYYKYTCKIFPEGREQFALSSDLGKVVLWGGITSNKNSDVWVLNPEQLEWRKLTTEMNYPPVTRFGHTGLLFEKKFIVFGGKAKNNNYTYNADLEYFNMDEKTWITPIINTANMLKLRKNHVAEIIGRQMVVHGGQTEQNEFLGDTHLLNLSPLKWITCSISDQHPGPVLSGHGACLVIPADVRYSSKFNIYKFPDLGIGRLSKAKIREKGWYIFGGRNKDDGGICNDLWILRIGKKPLEWIKADTSGLPPSPRYSHSQNYYEAGNYVIIHGGRNDSSPVNFALNDTFVLDLNKLEWMAVKLYSDLTGFNVYHRCGHSALIQTNKLIILGGMNNNNYVGSSLFIVHLDFGSRPVKHTDDEKVVESMQKNINNLSVDALKRLDRMKKKISKRQLSIIDELFLPEIK